MLLVTLALAASNGRAAAQDEAALRTAFEGRTIRVRIDMPATSRGIDVYPQDAIPVDFREVAQRLKDNGTALHIGQQVMITKVLVKNDSHVEFQLGGGGYGTFGDALSSSPQANAVHAGETAEEKALRDSIKSTNDNARRRTLQRALDDRRSERERENARAEAEARQANEAREANLRSKRAESGSRFNIRFHNGIPDDALTPEGVVRALSEYIDFGALPAAGAAAGDAAPRASGVGALRKGLLLQEVEAMLGPATTANETKEGSLTVQNRTYTRDGLVVTARFVFDVLIDFSIRPQ